MTSGPSRESKTKDLHIYYKKKQEKNQLIWTFENMI
jgi:hypothetical protein